MKPLMTPTPVLDAGLLCLTHKNSRFPFTGNSQFSDDASVRDCESAGDAVLMVESAMCSKTAERSNVCVSKNAVEIKY